MKYLPGYFSHSWFTEQSLCTYLNIFYFTLHTITGGFDMSELTNLLSDIEKLRENLYRLINEKGTNLVDEEIISASQMLNAAITKYNEILINKSKK